MPPREKKTPARKKDTRAKKTPAQKTFQTLDKKQKIRDNSRIFSYSVSDKSFFFKDLFHEGYALLYESVAEGFLLVSFGLVVS